MPKRPAITRVADELPNGAAVVARSRPRRSRSSRPSRGESASGSSCLAELVDPQYVASTGTVTKPSFRLPSGAFPTEWSRPASPARLAEAAVSGFSCRNFGGSPSSEPKPRFWRQGFPFRGGKIRRPAQAVLVHMKKNASSSSPPPLAFRVPQRWRLGRLPPYRPRARRFGPPGPPAPAP